MGRASDPDERKAELASARVDERLAGALHQLDWMCSSRYSGEMVPTSIKLRIGVTDEVETLCIVEAVGGDGTPVVGFNGAQSPSEALIGAINRIRNGQMKWRVDEYRSKGSTGRSGS